MCGDGANDCGALKAADAGISLSEAEASIAAPFTSAIQNISCVITLLREGRCAMTTSFQAFKFIELYSFIQFFTCLMCYCVDAAITDHQFLYIDLVALVPLSIFSAWTGPHPELNKFLPTETLFYFPVLLSVFASAAIQLGFQVYFYINVNYQSFYVPPYNIGDDSVQHDLMVSYEDTALFQISNFQYLTTCCAFLVAYPFRKPFYTNFWFTFTIVGIFICDILFLVLNDNNWLNKFFNVLPYTGQMSYKYNIAVGIGANTILTFITEKVIAVPFTAFYDRKMENK